MELFGGFNYDDPGAMGLLRFGTGLLGNGGQTNRGIAQGLLGMMQGGLDDRKRKADEEAMKQHMLMQGLQIQGLQSDQDLKRAQLEMQNRIKARIQGMGQPGQAGMPPNAGPQQDMPASFASAMPGMGGNPRLGGPDWMQSFQRDQGRQAQQQPQQPAGQQGGYSKQSELDRMRMMADIREQEGDVAGAAALREHILKSTPKVKEYEYYRLNGKLMKRPLFEDGTPGDYIDGDVVEKQHFLNTGGQTIGVGEYTGKQGAVFANTQDPNSIASNMVAMRWQDMTDARARELNAINREGQQTHVFNDPLRGPMLINKGTGIARIATGQNGQPIAGEDSVKRQGSADRVLPILTAADKLIDKATGSYVGAALDIGARGFGAPTEGDKATAQLKVLEGQLMMSQPRMEGPQSDKDVALYRQMAGQIGDPTVPREIKKAALEGIRAMNEKYASPGALAADKSARGPAAPANAGWSIQQVN